MSGTVKSVPPRNGKFFPQQQGNNFFLAKNKLSVKFFYSVIMEALHNSSAPLPCLFPSYPKGHTYCVIPWLPKKSLGNGTNSFMQCLLISWRIYENQTTFRCVAGIATKHPEANIRTAIRFGQQKHRSMDDRFRLRIDRRRNYRVRQDNTNALQG